MHYRPIAPPSFALLILLLLSTWAGARAQAQPTFEVQLPDDLATPATGRLVVYLIREGSQVERRSPADGPFWTDPQPLYGMDLEAVAGGTTVKIHPDAAFPDAFPAPPAELAAGKYRAQATLDLSRLDSSFGREGGDRIGEPVAFEVRPGESVAVTLGLENTVPNWEYRSRGGEEFVIESELLGAFHNGRPIELKAGVIPPIDYDPQKQYAAVYSIPGFGGRHDGGRYGAQWNEVRKRAFIIQLDSESPNGHTLFCDSRVNGPYAQALIEELIPELEARYPLISEPWARLVTGHSSGGWASLWLGTQYPDTFGATWSSGPDPVDFRRFELVDIYSDDNAYVRDGEELPAARFEVDGKMQVTMSVREENGGEGVLGPLNTSGQQWDSWMACWGTPDENNPRIEPGDWPVAKPVFDAETGDLDHEEAKAYEAYDIRLLLSQDPERYLPVFENQIRLVCGAVDNYYLDEAVRLLMTELQKQGFDESGSGYVKLIEGADHGRSLFVSEAMRAWPGEMAEHLKANGME